jgi:hypothetical protein
MNYLVFENKILAQNRSSEIAVSLGCGSNIDDATVEWFGVLEHPVTKEGALAITPGEEDKLTEDEVSRLLSEDFMRQEGWFPFDEIE